MKLPPTVNIKANGLADAYYQAIKYCLENGMLKRREYGLTKDIISLIDVSSPFSEPMLHPQFPTKELHLKEYLKQWERDYDWIKQGFEYNYMNRLIDYPPVSQNTNYEYYHKSGIIPSIDQLKKIKETITERIEKYKEGNEVIVSNRDQCITWIPDRDLFVEEDQPCLQRLQFFVYKYPSQIKVEVHDTGTITYKNLIIQKGKGEVHAMWRSRDLYGAWNSNVIGLLEMVKKEVFEPNNINIVRYIDFCNSLHIYEADWDNASKIKPIAINPQLMR